MVPSSLNLTEFCIGDSVLPRRSKISSNDGLARSKPMQITREEVVAGRPAMQIRAFVRRFDGKFFMRSAVERVMQLQPEQAEKFINEMVSLELIEPTTVQEGRLIEARRKFDRVSQPYHAGSAFEGGACEGSEEEPGYRGRHDGRRCRGRCLVWRCDLAGAVSNYLEQSLNLAVGRPTCPVTRKNLGARDLQSAAHAR